MAKHIDDNQNHALEEAMEQFVDSQLWEQEPNIDEFVKRYSEFENKEDTENPCPVRFSCPGR